ncbi:selenoprotein W-related protein [Halomicrobium zhouii]|uniref:Selenoprotein W-related protein n=1 Tax=Halomicrobium zhouii TaxID=767519 RepID=A0A1I6LJJ8_9EURY|nr:Rdx family protein [Halomicrobium zhouii]SFS03639.1 selenoprotein W-related protein [Halomicrobium zhouii]
MSDVTIEYCVPCGFRERAFEVQQVVLGAVEGELDSLELVMGDHGVFTVSVDGQTVYDKEEDAYDPDEIARNVRNEL